MTIAKTPGDWRASKNNLARLRRLLREAGVELESRRPPPVAPSSPVPTRQSLTERVALLEHLTRHDLAERLARLEADMAALLEVLTDPGAEDSDEADYLARGIVHDLNGNKHAPPPPEPPPKATPCKRRGRTADYGWLWRAMRYDDFMPYTAIAKETKRDPGDIATLLSRLKKLGLVQHRSREGWRKDRSVERLN
jgi:hypothetical protein